MTPKEKAKELFEKMYQYQWRSDTIEFRNAKQCALVAVDEIIQEMNSVMLPNPFKQYWNEVKQEIELL